MVVFVLIDLPWLAFLARPIYKWQLGDFLAKQPDWLAAGLFYFLYAVGINYFAINPSSDWKSAATSGAIFGFMTYMTYELTNKAVIDKWPWPIVFIDIAWGTILTAATATVVYLILNR